MDPDDGGNLDYEASDVGYEPRPFIKRCYSAFQLRGLDKVSKDLRKRGINIEDLVVSGNGAMRNVFHASAIYEDIGWLLNPFPLYPEKLGDDGHLLFYGIAVGLSVEGNKKGKRFEVVLTFGNPPLSDYHFLPPKKFSLDYEDTEIRDQRLIPLSLYFLQRQAAQQPEYKYTYRTRKEIKK